MRMKKRVLLTFIIAIFCCLIFSKTWYIKDELPVQFNMTALGKYDVWVVFNKKNNDSYKRTKRDFKKVNFDGDYEIYLNPKIVHPKRIKFIFIPKNAQASNIQISKIKLNNGEIKIHDLNNFVIKNAQMRIKDNTILIVPSGHRKPIELIYTKKLNVHGASHINFLSLFTILVISFLILYRLFNYAANYDFKKMQINSSLIPDIIFVIIFFVLLFVPMSKLDRNNYSYRELRRLNKFSSLFSPKYKLNNNFFKDFDAAFNDRFYTKHFFVPFFSNLRYHLHTKYCEVHLGYVYKNSGWMFINQSKELINDGLTPFTDDELNKITSCIKKLLEFGKDNNIKVYIVIVPDKEYIYQEEDVYHAAFEHENTYKLIQKVKKELNYEIIYPTNEFKKLKKEDYVYYKTDHHLTDSGSYELYKLIILRIKKDFPNIKITPISNFKVFYNNKARSSASRHFGMGGGARALIKDEKLFRYNFKYYDYKNLDKLTITENYPFGEHINPDGKYNVFIIGNSMVESLMFFLDTSFYSVKRYRFNSKLSTPPRKTRMEMAAYAPLIKKENPEILLIVLSTGNVYEMHGMYP